MIKNSNEEADIKVLLGEFAIDLKEINITKCVIVIYTI